MKNSTIILQSNRINSVLFFGFPFDIFEALISMKMMAKTMTKKKGDLETHARV